MFYCDNQMLVISGAIIMVMFIVIEFIENLFFGTGIKIIKAFNL